jgi:hypothetical protein
MTEGMMCGKCLHRLNLRRSATTGERTWEHPYDRVRDHTPQPVPVDERMIGICDFCSVGDPQWIYRSSQPTSSLRVETSPKGKEYRRLLSKREAAYAVVQDASVTRETVHGYDEGWAACEECARYIERRDVNRLVTHVKAVTRANLPPGAVVSTRAHLYQQWQGFFANLQPGRTPVQQTKGE